MLAFRQPYTNTAARSHAGTFIQHDNLNILRRYLHKPYLPDCLVALITLQFGALSRLHSRFSWVYKHVSIQMWQTPSTVSSGVALVLHSWIHPTYLDGHVKNQVPFLLKTEGGNTGGACTVLFPESPGRDAWTKPSPSSPGWWFSGWSRGRAEDRQCEFKAADRKLAQQDAPLQESHSPDLRISHRLSLTSCGLPADRVCVWG